MGFGRVLTNLYVNHHGLALNPTVAVVSEGGGCVRLRQIEIPENVDLQGIEAGNHAPLADLYKTALAYSIC